MAQEYVRISHDEKNRLHNSHRMVGSWLVRNRFNQVEFRFTLLHVDLDKYIGLLHLDKDESIIKEQITMAEGRYIVEYSRFAEYYTVDDSGMLHLHDKDGNLSRAGYDVIISNELH